MEKRLFGLYGLIWSTPHLSDILNNHKTPKNLRFHSSNEVIDYETWFGEWEIQLIMSINFISCKDSDETRSMSTKATI